LVHPLQAKLLYALPLKGGRVVAKVQKVPPDVHEIISGPDVGVGSRDETRGVCLPELGLKGARIDAVPVGLSHSVHGQEWCLCVEACRIDSRGHLTDMASGIRRFSSDGGGRVRVRHVKCWLRQNLGLKVREKDNSVCVLNIGGHVCSPRSGERRL
jgi:hypothetical protein